ncbi:hypothetical protein QM012_004107 [Aureobasidium pullulans]|uniref:Enoyl reductase (ER) domain-containing protein n=1 Tax=Aureobasidium pullulans TaxID=5580 RepID=A0ABR0T6Y2_AURPU
MSAPQQMRAWQYTNNRGGVAKKLRLESNVKVPKPSGPKEMLVKVLTISLNPVDHKPAETLLYHFTFSKPTTPGADFVGEVVQIPPGCSFQKGDRVFGTAKNAFAGGMLAEYAIADTDRVVLLGDITPEEGAAIPIAGLTAYQSILPRVKPKSRIFINGGSGGTGTFGIQIAIAAGHTVTVSCSGRNAEVCRSLGAEVIDYTQSTLFQDLKAASIQRKFDLVVDNIYTTPELFWKAHEYTTKDALYVLTPFTPTSPSFMKHFLPMKLLPRFLGGGQRKLINFFSQPDLDQLTQMRDWIADKQIKVVFDCALPFEQAKQAFERIATGRTVGKIIVKVAETRSGEKDRDSVRSLDT